MIRVVRTNKPNSLVLNAERWRGEYLAARAALAANPKSVELKKAKKQAEQKYFQEDVQHALREDMFHDKCGFCERKRDYSQIEHYRPKDSYPELCFEWLNLILACEVCNGASYKGTKFLLDAEGNPLLINPCEDDPNEHIEFVCEQDDASDDGFMAILKPKTAKGEATIRILGLNRLNLLKERNRHIAPYYLILALMARDGDRTAMDLLNRACQSDNIFAAFMRSIKMQIVRE